MELLTKKKVADKVVEEIKPFYDNEQQHLAYIGKTSKTEGEIREAAGNLVENILQRIFDIINRELPYAKIVSKVGSTDFLSKTIYYKGRKIINGTIQVDRHVYSNNKRICFIENKTYLDSCYYDRALADFRKIAQSLQEHEKDPAECKYIVFAGQDAASSEKLFTYEADFWNDTKYLTKNKNGLETKTFFFLKGKRSSSLPLYKVRHQLDESSIREFVYYILDLI